MTLSPTVPRRSAQRGIGPLAAARARSMPKHAIGRLACRQSTGTRGRPARPRSIICSRGGDMRQHAALRRDLETLADQSSSISSRRIASSVDAVGGRVDADHRVADAIEQAIQRWRRRCRRRRRSGGSAAAGWPAVPGRPERGAETGDDPAFARPPRSDPGCASAWRRPPPFPASGPAPGGRGWRYRRGRTAANRAVRQP